MKASSTAPEKQIMAIEKPYCPFPIIPKFIV